MGQIGDLLNLGVNTFLGAKKIKYAKNQLKNNKRPEQIKYDIPSSVGEAMKYYQSLSREGLPGENVIRDQMGASYAGAAGDVNRTADSGVGALGAMSGLYGKFMNSVRDLGVQSAQVKANNQREYALQNAGAQFQQAEYQDRAWDQNVNQPFQRGMNEYWATKQAGESNLWGGIDQIGSGIVQFGASQDKKMDQLLSMYTGGGSNLLGGGKLAGGYTPSAGATTPTAPSAYSGQPQINLSGGTNYSPQDYGYGGWGTNYNGYKRPGE